MIGKYLLGKASAKDFTMCRVATSGYPFPWKWVLIFEPTSLVTKNTDCDENPCSGHGLAPAYLQPT